MGYLLAAIALLGLPISFIVLTVRAIRKKRIKPIVLTIAGLFACFALGSILTPDIASDAAKNAKQLKAEHRASQKEVVLMPSDVEGAHDDGVKGAEVVGKDIEVPANAADLMEAAIAPGDTIAVGNVIFVYDGYYKSEHDGVLSEHFLVTNKEDYDIKILLIVVGVKKDGSNEFLGTGTLYGIDWDLYNKELRENGWALRHGTNTVKEGKTLTAMAKILDFGDYSMDVDGDGYYDVMFEVVRIRENGDFMITGSEPVSEVFKLKVH